MGLWRAEGGGIRVGSDVDVDPFPRLPYFFLPVKCTLPLPPLSPEVGMSTQHDCMCNILRTGPGPVSETHLLAGKHTMRFVRMLDPALYCCQLPRCPKIMRLVRTCSHDHWWRPTSKQSMPLEHMPTCIADILLTRTSLGLGLGCQCIQHIQ